MLRSPQTEQRHTSLVGTSRVICFVVLSERCQVQHEALQKYAKPQLMYSMLSFFCAHITPTEPSLGNLLGKNSPSMLSYIPTALVKAVLARGLLCYDILILLHCSNIMTPAKSLRLHLFSPSSALTGCGVTP